MTTSMTRRAFEQIQRPALTFAAGLARLLYPPACELCSAGIDDGSLCAKCRSELCQTLDDNICPRCAGNIGPYSGIDGRCDLCRRDSFAFERVVRLGRYDGALQSACVRIKSSDGHRLGWVLADLLYEQRRSQLVELQVDLVVAVPLHWRRRWRRGYDQSAHFAGRLARRMEKPLVSRLLARRRSTVSQTSLSPTERRNNPRGAFAARGGPLVKGSTILLVDDVLTTGATCHHAARELRSAGAAKVFVAVIARGDHVPLPADP